MILFIVILLLVQLILFVVKVADATPWGWGAVLSPGIAAVVLWAFFALRAHRPEDGGKAGHSVMGG